MKNLALLRCIKARKEVRSQEGGKRWKITSSNFERELKKLEAWNYLGHWFCIRW